MWSASRPARIGSPKRRSGFGWMPRRIARTYCPLPSPGQASGWHTHPTATTTSPKTSPSKLAKLQMGSHFGIEAIHELVQPAIGANRSNQYLADADLLETHQVVRELARRCHDALHVAASLGPFIGKAHIHAMTDRESLERLSDPRRDFFYPFDT